MKINRLKLKNFIGIKHGLDLDEVEIDFTKTDKKIIMLLGGNGAGKSVIMSMLHPFKESFDERKELVLPGVDGLKEIDIVHNGSTYQISHTYCKSAQSFIKKDGKELNENGGVRTFEEIVEKELGVTKDYFKIGKIGSNTENFVELTSTERKNYIGNFLNIDDILAKHAIANEKLKVLEKSIKSLGDELSKEKNEDVVVASISQLEDTIKDVEKKLSELYSEKGSIETKIDLYQKDIDNSLSVQDLNKRITEKQSDIKTNSSIISNCKTANPNIETLDAAIQDEIQKIQSSIASNIKVIEEKNILKTQYLNKIIAIENELQSIGSPEDLDKIKKQIEDTTTEMDEIKNRIKENHYAEAVRASINSSHFLRHYDRTKEILDFIEKYFSELSNSDLIPNRKNLDVFISDDADRILKSAANNSRSVINAKQEYIDTLKAERAKKEIHVCQLENLKKRPSECNIDNCPFIKDAVLHKNVTFEIKELDDKLTSARNDLEKCNDAADRIAEISNIYKSFINMYNSICNDADNAIFKKFTSEGTLLKRLSNLSEFQLSKQELLESVSSISRDISRYASLKTSLKGLENDKAVLEDKNNINRDNLNKNLNENNKLKDNVDSEINILVSENKKLSEELDVKRETVELFNSFNQATSKLASANTMLSTAKSELARITKTISELDSLKIEKIKNTAEIETAEKNKVVSQVELTKLQTSLSKISDLKAKIERLNKEYDPVKYVTDALSPKTGIPLILMKTYLEETEMITNDLLNTAFNGTFKIKFVTDSKNFLIQVNSKGNTKSDIKLASQGEIAITTISISLALIEQAIGDYNILCLDEIDGNLDKSNRLNFIDILNGQIDKLGIEQVFIISHNDAFDTAPVGMVLLKGHNINLQNKMVMSEKDIIFNLEGGDN